MRRRIIESGEWRKLTLNYFYNKCDFIVRFTYTQIPILRNLLRKIMFWRLYSSDFKNIDITFEQLKKTLCQYDISLKNQEILELGPGNSIALALNCLCCGSKKYWMADKYPRILKNDEQKKNLLEHIAYFEDKYHCSLNNYINKKNMELNESFLVYIQNGVEDLSDIPSSSIDIILSISVFEHVKNIDKSFQEMERVLKNGGIIYHRIDMRDHYNFNRPFKFLKYSDYIWNNFLTKEGFSYTNRLRVDDFEKLLLKYNFKIIELVKRRYEHTLPNKKAFNEKFGKKNIEDLRVIEIDILAKLDYNEVVI